MRRKYAANFIVLLTANTAYLLERCSLPFQRFEELE